MTFDKVYLASTSPRRKELLSKITNNFSVLKPNFVEPEERHFSNPEAYIKACVDAKVSQIIEYFSHSHSSKLALVADTTVFLKGQLLGKPKTSKEATEMLETLSGASHQVYTGYWVGAIEKTSYSPEQIKWEVSRVYFRKLNAKTIRDYVKSKEPMDKAGAYGFQGLGLQLIQKVEGSYSNIMGLPILSIEEELKKWMLL